MAKIYVSSTYRDLREHREAVYRALRQVEHEMIVMKDYVVSDQRPLERCLADVAASEIYLGIVAWRYGYVPEQNNPDGRSIIELEYREARRRGIPCLVFLLDEDALWAPGMIDRGEDGRWITAFRGELMRDHMVSFFYTVDGLATATLTAVHLHVVRHRALLASPAISNTKAESPVTVPKLAVLEPPVFGSVSPAARGAWMLPVEPAVCGVAADQATHGDLDVRAVSIVGPMHRCEAPGRRRQDSYQLGRDRSGRYLIIAVADGSV